MASVLWEASGRLSLQAAPPKQMKSAADVGAPLFCWCVMWILVLFFTPVRAPDPFHGAVSLITFLITSAVSVHILSPYSNPIIRIRNLQDETRIL